MSVSTFFTEIRIEPATEPVFLIPQTFTVTNHDNFVDHFVESFRIRDCG